MSICIYFLYRAQMCISLCVCVCTLSYLSINSQSIHRWISLYVVRVKTAEFVCALQFKYPFNFSTSVFPLFNSMKLNCLFRSDFATVCSSCSSFNLCHLSHLFYAHRRLKLNSVAMVLLFLMRMKKKTFCNWGQCLIFEGEG